MLDGSLALPEMDTRYFAIRHGDLHHPFPHYATLPEWEERAIWLREHIWVMLGLWPQPERPALNARIVARLDYDDYCVENVYFESWPGFYCTGNVYRPRGRQGPFPGILNPHGHWERGRMAHELLGSIRARCITFARMGIIAFSYDMVGYHDSLQVPRHRFASPIGSLWGLSPMALQTWNSTRAVDFLQSLEGVDPERIGCTGESGGGTQTFMVAAIDPRVKVVAPVNMISTHFQGGCVCENAPGLRSSTYNVEIAAMAAPRPMLMVSATGDWTSNTPIVEYPAVRSIYLLYDADDKLDWVQVDAPHNYNAESRNHVYRWFARWFLGDAELGHGAERDFAVEPDERLRVFPAGRLPAGTLSSDELEQTLRQAARERLAGLFPATPAALVRLREVTRCRWEHILGVTPPTAEDVVAELGEELSGEHAVQGASWVEREIVLGRSGRGDRLVGTLYTSRMDTPRRIALLVHGAGRAALQDGYGGPTGFLCALLDAGVGVLSLEPFYCGLVPAHAPPRHDQDWFWATCNTPLLGARVQDMLTLLAYLGGWRGSTMPLLVGLGQAGGWALLAAALSDVACSICVDMQALDVEDDAVYLGPFHAPLLRAYGALEVASALAAPRRLMLTNTAGRFPTRWVRAAYASAGVAQNLSETADPIDTDALMSWLSEGSCSDGRYGP